MTQPATPPSDGEAAGELRWQVLLRHARDPVFLVNGRRRLLFANRAWEACTGVTFTAVRGRPCRAGRRGSADPEDAVLAALRPPAEALAGQACRSRRRAPNASGGWWQLDFFPLQGERGPLGILGKITPLPAAALGPLAPLPDRLMALRDRHAELFRLDALATDVPAVLRVMDQARLAAAIRTPVTLVGEAGTGKHWLARAIHQAGPARDRCFARFDCSALPPALLSEWLLEPRGKRLAFGTIYLREPAELPREMQDRLATRLRADDSEAPRLIVGYRDDPVVAMQAGRLVPEFHCAASTLTIQLPPLRDRLADLDRLVEVFITRIPRPADQLLRGLSPEAELALRAHRWPGNLRELSTVLRDAGARAKGERIELADLPFFLHAGPLPAPKALPLDSLLEEAERRLIRLALRQARGNRTRAAELLGIWRPRLLRRMEHLGIEVGTPTAPGADGGRPAD